MFRKILIIILLSGIFLVACGGKETPGDQVILTPTGIPSVGEENVPPYPLDEKQLESSAYPVPDELLPYPAPIGSTLPYAPSPGDEDKIQGEVFSEGMDVRKLEGDSNEYLLDLNGSLPTPCHELRIVILPPNEEARIDVDVYSLLSPMSVCTQVLEPFEASVSLGTYTGGAYIVSVNGEKIGEIRP